MDRPGERFRCYLRWANRTVKSNRTSRGKRPRGARELVPCLNSRYLLPGIDTLAAHVNRMRLRHSKVIRQLAIIFAIEEDEIGALARLQ